MKLVIDIPDKMYETVQNDTYCGTLYEELKNGIPLSESEDCVSRQAVLNLAKFDGRDGLGSIIHAFDVEQLPPVNPAEKQEPCADTISRAEVLSHAKKDWGNGHEQPFDYVEVDVIKQLPPVTPQYTDAEIQKMQDLEFAEIQKAYEIGKEEGSEEHTNAVLDKIRAEIDEQYDRVHPYNISCAEGLEMALEIIDKCKASLTGAERSDKE